MTYQKVEIKAKWEKVEIIVGEGFFGFFLGKKWINSDSERRTLHRAWAIAEGKWG